MTPKGTYVRTTTHRKCHYTSADGYCRSPSIIIKRLDPSPTYAEFLTNHLINNRPALIGKDLVESWPAFHLWGNGGDKGDINWDYLANVYGEQTVSVTNCRITPTDSCTEEITLSEVISRWVEHDPADEDRPLLYVKDWHLPRWVSRNPAAQAFYATPYLFADDWLNHHYCTFTDDDFRFVYLGIKGTSTPFHKDVYDSYSWSTNVVGKKLWTFWTPDDEDGKQSGIGLIQEAGETVFVCVPPLSSANTPVRADRRNCSPKSQRLVPHCREPHRLHLDQPQLVQLCEPPLDV